MKITMPLQSQTASGTFGGVLTFSQRKTCQLARFQRKQKDRITPGRTTQRNKFLQARQMYPLQDFGKIQFGFNMCGGKRVEIANLPPEKRAPQFARWISDVLTFYK